MLGTQIFKVDSKGKTRIWKTFVKDNGTYASIHTITGLQDGKQVETIIDVREGKNINRSNATTPLQQAISEAEAKMELKLRGEYRLTIEDTKQGVLRSGIPAPMLAATYSVNGERKNSKTLKQFGILGELVGTQSKLDGNRMIVRVNKYEAIAYTRKGDVMPVQLEHVINDIRASYDYNGFTEEIILDGEAFPSKESGMSFNEANGLLKRFKGEKSEKLKNIKYYIYDVMMPLPYEKREDVLKNFESESVIKVKTNYVIATDEALKALLEAEIANGEEGLIIRKLNMTYEHKRSQGLIKFKAFEDSEFTLVGIERDKRGEFAGTFVLKMDKESYDSSGKLIETFRAGTTNMTVPELMDIWNNREKYLGKVCTVEYFERDSKTHVPRFGKMKELARADI